MKLGWIVLTAFVGLASSYVWNKLTGNARVPDVTGKTDMEASSTLIGSGFKNISREQVPGGVEGIVARQIPLPGLMVKLDSPLMLFIQAGAPSSRGSLGEAVQFKKLLLPVGTSIMVRMPSELLVQHQSAPSSYDAELEAPLEAVNGVAAMKGSRVFLDVSSAIDTTSTAVRLSVRECRLVDDRSLHLSTDQIDFHSKVTLGSLVAVVIVSTLIGAMFTGILDLGLTGGSLGFLVGIFLALVMATTGNKVDIPAGTELQFKLKDSVQVELASSPMSSSMAR